MCHGPGRSERCAWDRISGPIIGRPDQRGSTGRDNRMCVEGVLWIVRTGLPWRDLPEAFGEWNSVFGRFNRWSAKGVWLRMFEALADDPDFEYLTVDSTIVRAHPASGAKAGAQNKAIGRSRGGLTKKSIWLSAAWAARSVSFLTAGQAGDAPQAEPFEGCQPKSWRAMRPTIPMRFRTAIAAKGAQTVIPNNPSRATKYALNKLLCAGHLI
ncbi:IS5 family transposase [Bradyrhizobium sp. 142]|uniref:IS5 family transposase n=1 Tax=Bradyrhizobium sp. 142 TaxID=2782618 RepID=UPI001FF9C08B|nr:IS5 family transposase [Bradyrhizobium sp. 142]